MVKPGLLIRDDRIEQIIEYKSTNDQLDKNLVYFSSKYSLKATQVVMNLRNDNVVNGIEIRSADRILSELFL